MVVLGALELVSEEACFIFRFLQEIFIEPWSTQLSIYLIYSTALLRAGSTYADKVFYKQFALQFLPYQSSLQTICFAILYLSAETPHEDDVLAQADLTLSVKVCTL